MTHLRRALPVVLLMTVSTGCSATIAPERSAPAPRAEWRPLATSAPPAADDIRADRSAFLAYVDDRVRTERDRAQRYRRGSTLTFGVGVAIAVVGPLLLGWDYAEAMPVAIAPLGVGYGMRVRGERLERCSAALVELRGAFARKWTVQDPPAERARWTEYRRDQETILTRGPCQGGGS